MSDPSGQPSQEEIEAYYAQLREAPVGDLLMQCIGMLAAGAEAKLGMRDARVLIDSMSALVQHGGPHLGQSAEQLQQAVGQLQMAQVQLERQQGGEAAEGEEAGQPSPGGAEAPSGQAPPAGQAQAPPAGQPQAPRPQGKSPTDKLWIPGRDG